MLFLVFGGRPGIADGLARGIREAGGEAELSDVDFTSMRGVRDAVMKRKPGAVVFAGGMENLDACEADPDRAFNANAEAAIHFAVAALEAKAIPVYLSTAEVFGGRGGPWTESDEPAPESTYARSKLKGEQFLQRANKNALILRTGPITSEGWIEEKPRFAAPFEEAEDELISPSPARDVGRALAVLAASQARGLFHLAAAREEEASMSRAEYWRRIARAAGEAEGNVVGKPGRQIVRAAPYARRATLSRDKIERVIRTSSKEERKMGHRQEVRRVDKPWGHEIIWAHTERYVGKVLFIKAGERLSLQYHQKKDETVYVMSGKMIFEVGPKDQPREELTMNAGDSYHITPFTTHRMIAVEDTYILESSTPELDDVVRLEDKYGRAGTSSP